ncbi:hypothetical protein PIB30_063825 [Stylosanthes scabra]|uniref:Uncharacterized protein n=1 Tax=Stylosanthes scabra TaxID=79078 RepID=A0ABU6RLG3_9FABA|nr:hypothetical protein [Stylosanthes scabra]
MSYVKPTCEDFSSPSTPLLPKINLLSIHHQSRSQLSKSRVLYKKFRDSNGKIAKTLSTMLPNAFPSGTKVNPKGECKAINLRSGKILQDSKQGGLDKEVVQSTQPKSLKEAHKPTRQQPTLVKGKENQIPFPQQLRKEVKDKQFSKIP